jgi:hypothetical protein
VFCLCVAALASSEAFLRRVSSTTKGVTDVRQHLQRGLALELGKSLLNVGIFRQVHVYVWRERGREGGREEGRAGGREGGRGGGREVGRGSGRYTCIHYCMRT